MQIGLIVHSLRRNVTGALLIALQIAVTLAIVCNALSVIQQHLRHMVRPSGFDEPNVGMLYNQWVNEPDDLKARTLTDLAILRATPGVIEAEATNSFPMQGSVWNTGIKLKPEQRLASAHSTVYMVDTHAQAAFGLTLAAGRWFTAEEISDARDDETLFPATVILTQGLAQALFPHANALGQVIYYGGKPAHIVGIIERAQAPFTADIRDLAHVDYASFFPFQYLGVESVYVIRAAPGRLSSVMRSVQEGLYQANAQRVVTSVHTFAEIRHNAYAAERKASVILAVVCALMLIVTALGVIGLTAYWVSQRTRYIGMRRALGARRRDILHYFQFENLLIAATGALLGIVLGLSANAWLAASFAITRMSPASVCGAAAVVLVLCQAAALWPALRAASITPASALRGS